MDSVVRNFMDEVNEEIAPAVKIIPVVREDTRFTRFQAVLTDDRFVDETSVSVNSDFRALITTKVSEHFKGVEVNFNNTGAIFFF